MDLSQRETELSGAGIQPALLILEDGTLHRGTGASGPGEAFGEFVFNTGMTGYQEVLTDPSYCGQIVVMTYPEIGIYGVNPHDVESGGVQVAGFVVGHAIRQPFNQRATLSFTEYLRRADIVAIEGIDTRALTRHIRARGAMRGAISTTDLDPDSLLARVRLTPHMLGSNLAQEVSPRRPTAVGPSERAAGREEPLRIVVVDAGSKEGIVRELALRGASITLVPYDSDLDTVLSLEPEGVLVSNGPGDPAALKQTVSLMRGLLERRIPLAGICLGHQLLGLALGGTTYKMCFGHRGVNHPVKNLSSGRVLITTQNHGFAVDPTSLGVAWQPLDDAFLPANPSLVRDSATGRALAGVGATATMAELLPRGPLTGVSPLGFGPIAVTHLSLNDGTLEGMRLQELPALSVQFHPEARPGPHDARGFFDEFTSIMAAQSA